MVSTPYCSLSVGFSVCMVEVISCRVFIGNLPFRVVLSYLFFSRKLHLGVCLVRCRRSIRSPCNRYHIVRMNQNGLPFLGCVCLLSRSWGNVSVSIFPCCTDHPSGFWVFGSNIP